MKLLPLISVAILVSSMALAKPNVVIILTDDQGYGDLGTHGNPWIKTPHIDALATQSVRLDDYHASAYCVPARASFLTGRYADRTGIHNRLSPDWIARGDEHLMSKSFKTAGYATGMFGKWHLGDNYPFGPESRGFDEVLRHYGGAVGVIADYWDNSYLNDTYYQNGEPTKVSGYCTDVFFSAATQFIDQSVEQNKPFFVYLPTNAPHGPRICPPSYSAPYDQGKTKSVATFYGMIANIDENVGKLRAHLAEKNLDRDTIFIFTTDNGTAGGQRLFNAGMRGHKLSVYDGGHRVPFFLHWPAGGFAAEQRIETLTAHIDVFPTLLDLCGLEKPTGINMDGTSLLPLLQKGDHPAWPKRLIMTDSQKYDLPEKWATTAVMSERWRLIEGNELYDIIADPGQESDVYAEHPEVVAELSAWYDTLWAELEPALQHVASIPLGHPSTKTVMLNYHDCIDRHMFWFQNGTRNLTAQFRRKTTSVIDPPNSPRPSAFWPVDVLAAGDYTIELRRWPQEAALPIQADIPAGEPIYGSPTHRTTPGLGFPATVARLTIDGQQFETEVTADTLGAAFRVKLNAGTQHLSAKFFDDEGRSLDAFYVYVAKAH